MALAGNEVTTKRGFGPLARCSALATTRRSRLQLSSVRQAKSAKRRAGPPRGRALGLGSGEIGGDRAHQALVARQTEDVVDTGRLAPRHQLVPGKARIGAQQDLDPRPPGTDLADDAGYFIRGAGGRIDVRPPELGGEQMPAAEHVQRQIAIAVVIAVEEAAFLVAVQGIIRGVKVEDDLIGRRFVRLKIVTLSESEVNELHIGLERTMGALYLKDLADKTRRGLRGRVEAGEPGGGNSYGYDVVKKIDDNGQPVRGERRINPQQGAIVVRIFKDYARGVSPRAIAKQLNREGVPSPSVMAPGAASPSVHAF
jgi:Recombinase